MPAGTVGAVYAEQSHIDRTRKPYREIVQQDYRFKKLIDVLGNFSGLEEKIEKKEIGR